MLGLDYDVVAQWRFKPVIPPLHGVTAPKDRSKRDWIAVPGRELRLYDTGEEHAPFVAAETIRWTIPSPPQ